MLFKISQATSALLFMVSGNFFGFFVKNREFTIKESLFVTIISSAFVYYSTQYIGDSIDMSANKFTDNVFMATLSAIVGSIGLYYVSVLVKKLPNMTNVFAFLGVNSLFILGTHQSIRYILRFGFSHLGFTCYQTVIPIFILIPIISFPLILLTNKYFPILLGNNTNHLYRR